MGNKGDFVKLSTSQEEYLKTIYLLSLANEKIRVTDIAIKLNITKSSVSKALAKLSDLKLIKYQIYGEINLTNIAKEFVRQLLFKQDLIEMFLCGILNVSDEIAQKDAINIRHGISEQTENKLRNYIINVLKLNNEVCNNRCLNNDELCNECPTKQIRNKIENNDKWMAVIDKG